MADLEAREIIFSLKKPLAKKELHHIDLLNRSFKPEDIQIISDGAKITTLLREVDVFLLERTIKKICGTEPSPLSHLLDEILKIGSYGLKGKKRQYAGFNKERKVKARSSKEKQRVKHYYAQNNDFLPSNNPVPEAFVNKIICGDSKNILASLPDNCVDLIFTSPPYNFGLDYDQTPDAHFWQNYFDALFGIFDECIRVVKYGGRIVINIQPLFSDYIPSHHMISNHFIKKGMIWKGEILWEKNNYNCKYTAWGSWKSPSNPYLKYTWEFIEVFCKGDLKKSGDKQNADITADEFKKWVVGKWSIAPERRMKDYNHPAMFPEALAERVLKLFSFKNDFILDPFMGAGTSCVVARNLNRDYLGIDISPEYCQTAQKRLESNKSLWKTHAQTETSPAH